uniref:Uncharacterized protein n=1 Tax=Grammatophora oceanica TaxID=210454 RepID=A0A7S1Y507_9STRA|mmetsp:Transcript_2120/g.2846  ORF Transcript_2120/g.2846 Transcript_2120/m.2846 type:complete len:136 (+) Transcript_2120:1-408(+)
MGATVYSVDVHSILRFRPGGKLRRMPATFTLKDCLSQSSITVTGVPHPAFRLPIEALQPSSIVVNVASAEFPNVDEARLLQEVEDVKYVPNVGKVTTAILLQNLMSLHRRRILEVKRLLEKARSTKTSKPNEQAI